MPASQSKTEELLDLVKSLPSVKEVTVAEGLIDAQHLFWPINRYDAVPAAHLLLGRVQTDGNQWLKDCLGLITQNNRCYLCAIGYAWSWLEVDAGDHKEWILELLLRRDVQDFMILSFERKGFLGLIEEESEYLAFTEPPVSLPELPENIE